MGMREDTSKVYGRFYAADNKLHIPPQSAFLVSLHSAHYRFADIQDF